LYKDCLASEDLAVDDWFGGYACTVSYTLCLVERSVSITVPQREEILNDTRQDVINDAERSLETAETIFAQQGVNRTGNITNGNIDVNPETADGSATATNATTAVPPTTPPTDEIPPTIPPTTGPTLPVPPSPEEQEAIPEEEEQQPTTPTNQTTTGPTLPFSSPFLDEQ